MIKCWKFWALKSTTSSVKLETRRLPLKYQDMQFQAQKHLTSTPISLSYRTPLNEQSFDSLKTERMIPTTCMFCLAVVILLKFDRRILCNNYSIRQLVFGSGTRRKLPRKCLSHNIFPMSLWSRWSKNFLVKIYQCDSLFRPGVVYLFRLRTIL